MIGFRRSCTGPTSTLRRRLGHQMMWYTKGGHSVARVGTPRGDYILLQPCLQVGKAIHTPAKDERPGLSGPFSVISRHMLDAKSHRAYTQQDGGRSIPGRKTGRLTMRSIHDAALPSCPRGQRALPLLGLLALALLALLQLAAAPARADATHVDAVNFNMDVDPGSASFLTGAIDTAQHDGASLLLINLDTPGGDLDSMKTIVQAELASTVPIVVYVSPSGGLAGSAASFVALAAPGVAMGPNTRIGAASPIDSSGGNRPPTLDTQIQNDLEADIRSPQTSYGRNVEL